MRRKKIHSKERNSKKYHLVSLLTTKFSFHFHTSLKLHYSDNNFPPKVMQTNWNKTTHKGPFSKIVNLHLHPPTHQLIQQRMTYLPCWRMHNRCWWGRRPSGDFLVDPVKDNQFNQVLNNFQHIGAYACTYFCTHIHIYKLTHPHSHSLSLLCKYDIPSKD